MNSKIFYILSFFNLVVVNENIKVTVIKRPFANKHEAAFFIIYNHFVARHPVIKFYSFALGLILERNVLRLLRHRCKLVSSAKRVVSKFVACGRSLT